MANVVFKAYELPTFDSVSGTELMAKRADGEFGYVPASQLQTTLDGNGLATDGDITLAHASSSAYSSSIASAVFSKFFRNTVTGSVGSAWNDASASAVGVPVGGLYHSQGIVKVRLA